jgi:flagellar hook-associated protein 2
MSVAAPPLTSSVGAIDVSQLVSSLMSSEAQQLTPLTTAASSYNAQLSAYGTVSSALSTFENALTSLNSAAFSAQKSTISNSGTSGTIGTVTTGAFTADINTAATTTPQSQVIQSTGINATTSFTAGDSLAIKVGTASPVFVTLGSNTTLGGVVDAINNANTGVEASITTDDTGSHLVLTADTSGTANTIRVTGNGTLSQFAYDPAAGTPSTMTQTQAPQDVVAAISGSYDISVTQLAQNEKIKSASIPDTQTFNNSSGVLAIKTGTNTTTLIQPTSNTLTGIRDAINASNSGVNATIVDNGTSSNLVLTSSTPGAANTITVTGTGDYSQFSTASTTDNTTTPPTVTPSKMSVMQPAQDAIVNVDGVPITSPTNTVTNAIAGVTLNLTTITSPADDYSMSVSNDASGVQSTAQTFVNAYNSLIGSLGPLGSYDATTKAAGALQGDSTLSSIINQIRNALIQPVSDGGALQTLNDVGISLQKDGTLALNTTTLTAATTNNFNSIQDLFNSPTDGIVTSLTTLLTSMTDPTTGIVANRTTGIQASLTANAAAQTQMQAKLTADQAMYTTQFNALNVSLTAMQNTQAQLTSELASLTANTA